MSKGKLTASQQARIEATVAKERADVERAMIYANDFSRLLENAQTDLTEAQFSIFIKKICRQIGWSNERVFINPSSKSRSGNTEFKNPKQQAMVEYEIISRLGLDNPSYLKPVNPKDRIGSVVAFIAFNFLPIDSSELYK